MHHSCGLDKVLSLNLQEGLTMKRVVIVFNDVEKEDVDELNKF